MNAENPSLGRASSAFALAASIAILFNTVLACAKDASAPLKLFLASLSDHDWTTQGLLDVILFFALGFLFMKSGVAEKIGSNRAISILAVSVIVAGAGLFAWYALF
jgi:hypothetical protein